MSTILQITPNLDPKKRYQIRLGDDQVVYCTCASWRFSSGKGDAKTCKHKRAFVARAAMIAAVAAQLAAR